MDISSSINIPKFVIFQVISISINLQLIPQYPAAKWWIYPAPPPGRKRSNAVHARPAAPPSGAPGAPRSVHRHRRCGGWSEVKAFGPGRLSVGFVGAMVDPKWSKWVHIKYHPATRLCYACIFVGCIHSGYIWVLSKDVRLRFSETWIQVYDRSRWAISETQGSRKKHQQIHIWEGTILLLTTRLYKNDVYGNFLGYRLKENDVCGYGITFKGGIAEFFAVAHVDLSGPLNATLAGYSSSVPHLFWLVWVISNGNYAPKLGKNYVRQKSSLTCQEKGCLTLCGPYAAYAESMSNGIGIYWRNHGKSNEHRIVKTNWQVGVLPKQDVLNK